MKTRTMRGYHLGAVATLATLIAGCFDYIDNCELALTCAKGTGSASSSSSTGSGGSGGHGGGGSDGGPPTGCVPAENPLPVDDVCGVFVSSQGDDTNAGTKGKPLKTLGAALTMGQPVYACGETFTGAVNIGTSVTMYGGLDCANGWVYDPMKKAQLTATADAIPLLVSKAATTVELNDFAITAADASKDGGSSVAVLVAQAAVSFTRCDVSAGNGKAGLAGAAWMSAAAAGADGKAGGDACSAAFVVPGLGVTNMCGGGDSISGDGGNGSSTQGGTGSPGLPLGTMNAGAGEIAMACTAGMKGDDGTPGTAGSGATGLGTLSASGYTGPTSGEGAAGKLAQGGGGGGGAKGETNASVCPAGSGGGASGGSGSSGGCGGLGGKGGMAGGASIAIVSLDATLTFSSTSVKAAAAGNGGDGGNGQSGGPGGAMGGAGGKGKGTLKPACAGGIGGKGGDGGKGGGGLGGHAIGIAVTGKMPATTGVTFVKGAAGGGGKGDKANGNMGDGAAGILADVQVFP